MPSAMFVRELGAPGWPDHTRLFRIVPPASGGRDHVIASTRCLSLAAHRPVGETVLYYAHGECGVVDPTPAVTVEGFSQSLALRAIGYDFLPSPIKLK